MDSLILAPVVLAGGSGTRLWPLSRSDFPKQLLQLKGSSTLLQETVLRLDGLGAADGARAIRLDPATVVCNEEHRFLTLEQLEAAGRPPGTVILEPVARNTAPALTLAALRLLDGAKAQPGEGPDPVMLVAPADHAIRQLDAYHLAVREALQLAAEGRVVTFGVVPTRPETGYGYIHSGPVLDVGGDRHTARELRRFVEKPDRATAEHWLAGGEHYWNSGMFVLRASVWLAAMERFAPDILEACRAAVAGGSVDGCFFRVDREAFAASRADSIDYAVMEPLTAAGDRRAAATQAPSAPGGVRDPVEGRAEIQGLVPAPLGDAPLLAAVVPLDAGWSDVGSWPALVELAGGDAAGNVVQGDVYAADTTDCVVVGTHRFVATLGLSDAVVVETADAVLVASRERCQEVRGVVDWLAAQGRQEGRTHRRVYRPWGAFEQLDAGERYQVKRLTVKPGAALSLQMHHHRAEHWVVVRGTARVTRGEEIFLLGENQSTYIPLGTTHRLENPGKVELEVIEVQSGSYLGEDDIVRLEDRYRR